MERRVGHATRLRRRIEIRYGPGKPESTGYSGNISASGVMLRAVRVYAPDTILELEIILPDKTWRMQGKVRWAREGSVQYLGTGRVGMGIAFLNPPAEFVKQFVIPAAPARKAAR